LDVTGDSANKLGSSVAALASFVYDGGKWHSKTMHEENVNTMVIAMEAKKVEQMVTGERTLEKGAKLVRKLTTNQHHIEKAVKKLRKMLTKVNSMLTKHDDRSHREIIGKEVYGNQEPTEDLEKRRQKIVEYIERIREEYLSMQICREKISVLGEKTSLSKLHHTLAETDRIQGADREYHHESMCMICQRWYQSGEEIRDCLPCGHGFHSVCVDLWFHANHQVRCNALLYPPSYQSRPRPPQSSALPNLWPFMWRKGNIDGHRIGNGKHTRDC
jgi:hypothetical protein